MPLAVAPSASNRRSRGAGAAWPRQTARVCGLAQLNHTLSNLSPVLDGPAASPGNVFLPLTGVTS